MFEKPHMDEMPIARSFVLPSGVLTSARLIVVGLQPSLQEVRVGRGFQGGAGNLLDDFLSAANVVRGECFLTHLFPTLDYHISRFVTETPKNVSFSELGQSWIKKLRSDIAQSDAPIILALGNVAMTALTGREGIYKWRGSLVECTLVPGKWVLPIIDPEACLPPRGSYLNKYLSILDCQKIAPLVAGQKYEPPSYRAILRPSFLDSMSYLKRVQEEMPNTDNLLAFDIEVMNGEVSCISFANSFDEVISIAFCDDRGDIFNPEQETEIWQEIANILETPNIRKLGQNLTFDTHFLLRKYGIRTRNLEDTMIAQQVTMPDFPKGLDFITSIHTPFPYYKDEGKTWFRLGGSMENLWHYNCLDSLACYHAWPKLWEELKSQGNIPTYERQRGIIHPLVYMMERGISVDLPGILAEREALLAENADHQRDLETLAGMPLNPNSPKQLKEFFYVHKKFPPYKGKITKTISVDSDALKRLSRKGSKEASILLKIRKNAKISSTYLVPEKFDHEPDGSSRIRCSYNPVGTRYSRLSSSSNIFGTGMNLQNWPHKQLKYMMADPGYIGYAFDLSQAENRIVAYYGLESAMIDAFEKEKDVHSLTAALIFNKPVEEVTTADGTCSLGTGEHSERFWGKKCVVGSTEILTPGGWLPIDQWDWERQEIAQWEPLSRDISFTKATALSTYESEVVELSGRNAHVIGTPNHRIPLYRKDTYLFKVEQLGTMRMDSHYGIPTGGNYHYSNETLSHSEVQLLVAFQADGSFNHNSHRFKFSKPRKIQRIKAILDDLLIPYHESIQGDGSTLIGFRGPDWLTKDFDEELLKLGHDQMRIFVDELPHWDGHISRGREYFSTNKKNVQWAQTIAHLTGHTALIEEREPTGWGKKLLYVLNINSRNNHAMLGSLIRRTLPETSTVYGPEVPTGFFLIRSNGKISVTGNSNHGLNYDLGYRSFALYYEMPERDAKFIVERYHRAYPGVRSIFHKSVRDQLHKDRTITNLMGRRTVFLGRLDDATFKEAYSCIPQGTVGDIINERGLNFIYYNDDPAFSHVELLSQTHDEVTFQIPESLPLEEHVRLLLLIKESLEIPLTVHGNTFVIPADLTVFRRFKTGEELKGSKFPRDASALKEELERIIGALPHA